MPTHHTTRRTFEAPQGTLPCGCQGWHPEPRGLYGVPVTEHQVKAILSPPGVCQYDAALNVQSGGQNAQSEGIIQ